MVHRPGPAIFLGIVIADGDGHQLPGRFFAVGDGEIEVEEGYFQTRKFLPGLQLRGGKFYSGFGYINKQHPHQWDFVDQNLPYDMLLGGSVDDTGVQLTWLPSLPFYTQLGLEALQGGNEGFSAQLGTDESPFFDEKAGPRLFTGWLNVSPNVGYSHANQLGASYAHSTRHQELVAHGHDGEGEDVEGAEPEGEEHVDEAFQGDARVLGLDFVWKYDSPRQFGQGDFTLQAEYLRRVKDLSLVGIGEEAAHGLRGALAANWPHRARPRSSQRPDRRSSGAPASDAAQEWLALQRLILPWEQRCPAPPGCPTCPAERQLPATRR